MALVRLVYVSSADGELAAAELQRVLDSSVHHNVKQCITGMLLYSNGSFMQILEGAEAAVTETYARIVLDPRHMGVILIDLGPIEKRSFGRWNMGFKHLEPTDVTAHPAYAPFFSDGFDAASIGAEPGVALEMLRQFSLSQRG